MLCPKCSFTTFDYADTCKKCGYDLKAYRESKGISASKPVSISVPKPEKKIEAAPIDLEIPEPSEPSESVFAAPNIEETPMQTAEASFDEGFAAPPPPPPISEEPISEPAYESLPAYPDADSLPKGGFWIRFAAVSVDGIILLIVQGIFGFFVGMGVGMGSIMRGGISDEGQLLSMIIGFFINILIGMAYHIFFVGWRGQTPGKMALKLKIIQTNGEEMTYGKAFLRWVGYSISGLTLGIGYLMVAFTKQKQGLHDKIAGTYVIRL